MAELSDTQWQFLVDGKRGGTLTPKQDELLQQALVADRVPAVYREEILKGRDPQESTLSAASPTDVSAAQRQPPYPPEADTWGQTAIQVGLPLAVGMATGGNPVATGAAAGAGHFLAHAPLAPPDPNTEPMAAGEVRATAGKSARVALETGGATALGGVLAPAAAGSGILTRAATEGGRAVLSGVGAAAGSLAAEPLDPSGDPIGHAVSTGAATAEMQGGLSLGFAGLTKGLAPFKKTLTVEGDKAAQVLAKRGLTIPTGEVSESNLLKSAAFMGERSIGGGTIMRLRGTQAENNLVNSINATVDSAKIPTAPGTVGPGGIPIPPGDLYKNLDKVIGQQLTFSSRPVFLDTAQAAAQNIVVDLRGQSAAYQGVPGHTELLDVAGRLAALPGKVRAKDLQQVHAELDTVAQIPNLPRAIIDRLTALKSALGADTDSPRVIDMGAVSPQIATYITKNKPYLPPEMHAVADRLSTVPARMSFDEAQELRSSLLAIARSTEPGGASRAPTPSGQRPEAGTGARFATRIGGEARSLAGIVDSAMEAGATDIGGNSAALWRNADTAFKVKMRGEWLSDTLDKTRDAVTGRYDGKAILTALDKVKNDEALPGLFKGDTIEQIKSFANALHFVQEGQNGSGGHGLSKLLHSAAMPATQIAASGYTYATGHPGLSLLPLLTPTALGLILQSPALSRWLTLGLTLPPSSKVALDSLSRLTGVLYAEGLLGGAPSQTPATPTQPIP